MTPWFYCAVRTRTRPKHFWTKILIETFGGYSFDVRGRPMAQALKWSSDEDNGGFGPRASFVVFNSGDGRGSWLKQHDNNMFLDEYVGGGTYDNSSRAALRVTNVTEQDAGAYRCRVDFRDSPTRNYRIILKVIGQWFLNGNRQLYH